MKKRVAAGGVIAAVAAAVLIFGLMSGRTDNGGAALPVAVTNVSTGEMVTKVKVKGNVALKEPVRIYASNNGKIKHVLVSEGDYVKKGQVLFTYDEDNTDNVNNQLDDARLSVKQLEEQLKGLSLPADESEIKNVQAEIARYESNIKETGYSLEIDKTNLQKAQTDLDRAQEDYNKNKQLFEGGVIAQSELNGFADKLNDAKTQLENSKTQFEKDTLAYDGANAGLEAAKAKYNELITKADSLQVQNQIAAMEVQLSQARLKVTQLEEELSKYKTQETAPFDGRVSKVNQNDGATVLEDTSVLEMVNENDTSVYIDIPESDMPGIKEGLDVILTGDGFEGEIRAKIKSVKFEAEEKQIDNANKNVVEAELEVENKSVLRPGYTLKADVIKAVDKNAVIIPVMDYLTDEDGKDYVYIVNAEGKLEKRFVTLKDYSDMYISVEGLKQGEKIVSTPDGNLLSEGMAVTEAQEDTTLGEAVSE